MKTDKAGQGNVLVIKKNLLVNRYTGASWSDAIQFESFKIVIRSNIDDYNFPWLLKTEEPSLLYSDHKR